MSVLEETPQFFDKKGRCLRHNEPACSSCLCYALGAERLRAEQLEGALREVYEHHQHVECAYAPLERGSTPCACTAYDDARALLGEAETKGPTQ